MPQIHDEDYQTVSFSFVNSPRKGQFTISILSKKVSMQVCKDKEAGVKMLWDDSLKSEGFKKYSEIYYIAKVDEEVGIYQANYSLLDTLATYCKENKGDGDAKPYTSFVFTLEVTEQENEKTGYKDLIYTIVKVVDSTVSQLEIEENTTALFTVIERFEKKLMGNTVLYTKAVKKENTAPVEQPMEDVNPDDIPF